MTGRRNLQPPSKWREHANRRPAADNFSLMPVDRRVSHVAGVRSHARLENSCAEFRRFGHISDMRGLISVVREHLVAQLFRNYGRRME